MADCGDHREHRGQNGLAERFHECYLRTARELGWPIRPEVDVPYAQLSPAARALDIALVAEALAWLRERMPTREEIALAIERVVLRKTHVDLYSYETADAILALLARTVGQ